MGLQCLLGFGISLSMKKIVFLLLLVMFLATVSSVGAHGEQGTTDTRLNLFEDPEKKSSLADGVVVGKLTISHNVVSLLFSSLGEKDVPKDVGELLDFTKKNGQKILDLLKSSDKYVFQNDTKVCLKDSFVIDDISPEQFEGVGLLISFKVDCSEPIGILKVKNGLFYDLGLDHFNFVNVVGRGDELIEGSMLSSLSNETEILVGTPSAKPETFGEFKKNVVKGSDGVGKNFGVGIGGVMVGLVVGGFFGFRMGKKVR